MTGIWRQRADIAPALVILAVLGVQLSAFFFLESLSALFAVMVALLLFSACPGSISHNHHHYPTFRYQWMNRIYEVILFLQTGVPPFAWTIHHNIGHHRLYLEPEKDPSGWINPDGSVMHRIKYDLYNAAMVYPEIARIGRTRPKLYRKFKLWTAVSLAVLSVFIWINPVNALILFVLPMPIMLVGLLDNTYQQHQDLDTSSDYTASRNTVNRLYNLISWNLGYHTAHHLNPTLHWSQLPKFHEEIRHRIPRHLVCDSVLLSACDRQRPLKPLGSEPAHAGTPGRRVAAQRVPDL